ncbi:MAG: helix-turn-helix transcriptional regulator [Gammaproteobacteria bacterium]
MSAKDTKKPQLESINVFETDERYHHKLSDILRKRRRPLLMVIDTEGDLVYSSVPDSAMSHDHRLLGQALAEARNLFSDTEFNEKEAARQLIVDKPGERSALVLLENDFFSLKLFPLHGPIDDLTTDKYAAVVEPIVKPLSEGVEFDRVQKKWRLSKREVDVLKALMGGDPDKEIARVLEVSVETVRAYLKSIRAKLGVATRTAIVHVVHQMHSEAHRDDLDRRI